jgi:hypothetical protein
LTLAVIKQVIDIKQAKLRTVESKKHSRSVRTTDPREGEERR